MTQSLTHTLANEFFHDANVTQAKKTLLQSLASYKSRLTDPKAANPELKSSYAETIKNFQDMRGGNLFFPFLGSGLGNGPLVELADGSVKYDFINGIGVHHFGHSHEKLIDACLNAALCDTVMQGNLQQNLEAVKFTKLILDAARGNGSKLAHCFLSSTGVMSGENALKMAFQKKHPADRVLAFEGCFMGRTLALSQMTDKPAYREGLPLNYKVDYLPFFDWKDPKGSTERSLAALRRHLSRYPKQHAAMSFELILGEGGFYPAERSFYVTLMDELKKHDIAILVDEVQSFARTPSLFAFQHFALEAYVDIVWIGKASQACATLFTPEFKPRPGLLSQTFTAASTALAAGCVIVEELVTGGYFGKDGKIENFHKRFHEHFLRLEKKFPDKISGPYGIGAMVGFTPFGGNNEKVTKFIHALYDNGVMAFTAGSHPARARFLIPLGCLTDEHIDAVIAITEKTLAEMPA